MRHRPLSLFGVALVLAMPAAAQQASRPYTDGGVREVQYIRVKPGHFDEYMTFLAGPYKQQMEAQKKAGVITGWGAYQSDNRDENDWNIVLTTDYKNMAALDNLRDRVDPITQAGVRVVGQVRRRDGETRRDAGHRRQPPAARADLQVAWKQGKLARKEILIKHGSVAHVMNGVGRAFLAGQLPGSHF